MGAAAVAGRATCVVKAAETRADMAKLWEERDVLFAERASASPAARGRIDARLNEIARTIPAAFEARGGRAVATLCIR